MIKDIPRECLCSPLDQDELLVTKVNLECNLAGYKSRLKEYEKSNGKSEPDIDEYYLKDRINSLEKIIKKIDSCYEGQHDWYKGKYREYD